MRPLLVGWLSLVAGMVVAVGPAAAIESVLAEDSARFVKWLTSPVPERRIDALQGLGDLKHWPAEEPTIHLLSDPVPEVRRAAIHALGRFAGAKTVPRFIALLDEPSWELRRQVGLCLRVMTAQGFAEDDRQSWEAWWNSSTLDQKQKALLDITCRPPETPPGKASVAPGHQDIPESEAARRAKKGQEGPATPTLPERRQALRALSRLATPAVEQSLIKLLREPQSPPLDKDERTFVCEGLERCGSAAAIPLLAAERSEAAAWTLGRIGGGESEQALLRFPPTLPAALALDRLHSTNTAPLIPSLVGQMGQITFRGQPDDIMSDDLQPIQRVGAKLIRRTGWTGPFIECVLQELENTMKPPIVHGVRPAHPAEWDAMLQRMRSELRPGFVREDGTTTSQPIVAMCYLLGDEGIPSPQLSNPAPMRRLIALLHHPAVVPRVYVALALGRLQAREAVPELVAMVREGYTFSDSTALASGKHFDQSQTVRWLGFVCMALGRMGGDEARAALEQLAIDPKQPRDIRYGAVVGLRFIGSARSIPALERAGRDDLIWLVRDEARQTIHHIQIATLEATP